MDNLDAGKDAAIKFDPEADIDTVSQKEAVITRTKKHVFGLLVIYLATFLALGLGLYVMVVFVPAFADLLGFSEDGAANLFGLFSLIIFGLGVIFSYLAHKIYWQNELIFTSQSVTQVLQVGLFNKKTSELSVADIEDVTVEKSGILPTLFNFGTLRIETAGEQKNFIFKYCPNPGAYANTLLEIRSHYGHPQK